MVWLLWMEMENEARCVWFFFSEMRKEVCECDGLFISDLIALPFFSRPRLLVLDCYFH